MRALRIRLACGAFGDRADEAREAQGELGRDEERRGGVALVQKLQDGCESGPPDLELFFDADLDPVFRRDVELLDIEAEQSEWDGLSGP